MPNTNPCTLLCYKSEAQAAGGDLTNKLSALSDAIDAALPYLPATISGPLNDALGDLASVIGFIAPILLVADDYPKSGRSSCPSDAASGGGTPGSTLRDGKVDSASQGVSRSPPRADGTRR